METEELLARAQEKLKRKNLDLICANDLTEPGAGFAVDTNLICLIDKSGKAERVPLMGKEQVASIILDRVREILNARCGRL
jgi:phosphopantothenoylcysteine decarboxylase/phosphopantothenate--cysteine ligase